MKLTMSAVCAGRPCPQLQPNTSRNPCVQEEQRKGPGRIIRACADIAMPCENKWARGDAERAAHHKEHKAHKAVLRALARDPFLVSFVLLVVVLAAPRLELVLRPRFARTGGRLRVNLSRQIRTPESNVLTGAQIPSACNPSRYFPRIVLHESGEPEAVLTEFLHGAGSRLPASRRPG